MFSEGFVARINLEMKQMEESLISVLLPSLDDTVVEKKCEEIQGTADCLTSASEPPPRGQIGGRKWPRPEVGRGQRWRMEGGTEGTSSGRDPHGVVDGRRKQKNSNKEKQQRSSRQTGSGCQAVIRRREKQMNLFPCSGK